MDGVLIGTIKEIRCIITAIDEQVNKMETKIGHEKWNIKKTEVLDKIHFNRGHGYKYRRRDRSGSRK